MLFLRYYLWAAPHVLLGIVLIASLRRRIYKQLPVFFAFITFEIVQFLVLFSLTRLVKGHAIGVYRLSLLFGAAISSFVQLGVLYELAENLILSRTSLQTLLRPIFKWALVALVLIAAITCGLVADVSPRRVVNLFQMVDFSSSLIQAGMLVVLFVFSRALQISWRSWPMGAALGFGISACINLAAAALRPAFGKGAFVPVDITQMAAFHAAALIWLIYAFLPEHSLAQAKSVLEETDIQFWNQELQRLAKP